MDYSQPWNQNNFQQFPAPGSGFRAPIPQQAGNLSRAERLEAQRLAEEANFSFEGYQVVRREFISHRYDPAMTVKPDSITFNNSCISKLEEATYIQFLINPTELKLVIRPCDEGARDAVRWCTLNKDKRKSRQITCKIFTAKLYEMLGWEPLYRYRLQGMRIRYDGSNMYMFDLSSVEPFLPQSRDPETGKLKQSRVMLPAEWRENFGMSVEAHTASSQFDLNSGFTAPLMNGDQIEISEVTT